MFKNDNTHVLKKISNRKLNDNRTRNIFILLAIILTTVLFTAVTTLTITLMEELNFEKFRSEGTTAHGFVRNVTKNELEEIKNNPMIKSVGEMTQVIDRVESPKLRTANISLCYLDSETISTRVYYDLNGSWPEKEDEIALPTWVLDKLELPHTLGQKITFNYNTGNKYESKEFSLSAYYTEYTKASLGERGFGIISKKFKDNLDGTTSFYITLNRTDNISNDFQEIFSDIGIDKKNIKLSDPYRFITQRSIDEIIPYIVMIIIIIVCGYLLIYNIFYISVIKDIKFYGLLKAIGTTSKQLKSIIIKECLHLSILGIPIGMIIGYGICFIVGPLIVQSVNVSKIKISFNPIIFLLTIIFVLLTIILSCRKPAKIAGKVSPIEALKYSGTEIKGKKSIKKGNKGAKIYKMALANVFRDKKRAIIVILSLTLGFTCFICAISLSNSLKPDAYINTYVPVDFKLENTSLQSISRDTENQKDYMDDNLFDEIINIDGIKNINIVSLFRASLEYEGALKLNSDELLKQQKSKLVPKSVDSNILGVNEHSFDHLSRYILEGSIDTSKLKSGKYAVVSNVSNNSIKVGDKINIGTKDNPKDVEVMAVLRRNTYTHLYGNGPDILINDDLLRELYPETKTFVVTFDIEGKNNEEIYDKLKKITNVNPYINIKAKHIEKQLFIESQKGTAFALSGITLTMAFIGILNFINTMITSINTRKIEIAMLESMGMTKKQMKKMLTLEGIYYGVISLFIVATLGNILAYYLVEAFKHEANYAVYYFPTIPLLSIAAVIIITSIFTPKIIFYFNSKKSIVDRLRDIN